MRTESRVSSERCDWGSNQRIDYGIAEQVEPDRRLLARREDVDDAAAHGEIPHLVDEIGAPEPIAGEVGHQLLDGVVLARLDRDDGAEIGLARGQPPEEGARGGDHGGQLP